MVVKEYIYSLLISLIGFPITGCVTVTQGNEGSVKGESGVLKEETNVQFSLNENAGRISTLSFRNKKIPLKEAGGFYIYDATNDRKIKFTKGSVKKEGNKTIFDASEDNVQLQAEFIPDDRFILVKGRIKDLNSDERGVLLDYTIPIEGKDRIFSYELNSSVNVTDSTRKYMGYEKEGNVFPIASMSSKGCAIAMAIPPSEPRIFGMAGNVDGLVIRFYLGLSPITRNFPNQASFVFIIYPVEPGWGFRNALSKYYSFYPEYYTPVDKDGLWMKIIPDNIPSNIHQYGIKNGIGRSEGENDLLNYQYMNIGPHHLSKLPKHPSSREEAMELFRERCAKKDAQIRGPYYGEEENISEWCTVIDNSVCKHWNGEYLVIIKGEKNASFKLNPNPYLFEDEDKVCVGRNGLNWIDRRFAEFPQLDAILIDSQGSNWPAVLNYRKDHFRYTIYPLTLGPDGRVAIHNQISFYEFLEAARDKLHSQGRYLFGNGIYEYISTYNNEKRPYPEHYRGEVKVGRFFLSSLLDFAGHEAGIRADIERCQYVRGFMGPKLYSILNYNWEGVPGEVEDWLNRSLAYALFSTNVGHRTREQYVDNPDGYLRDKELLDWFVPKVRLLHRAGWEPITYAEVEDEQIIIERYGSGDDIYFTLINISDKEKECNLTIDLKSLGVRSGEFLVNEIARGKALDHRGPNKLRLELEPLKTCIIAIQKY
jgi:hypothetical protein